MIIGCDPASKKIALFGIRENAHEKFFCEVPKSTRWSEMQQMRSELVRQINIWRDYNPVLFCEEPVVAGRRNIRSTILIAETVGLILSLPIPVYIVPVSSWKKETVGNGAASKDAVSQWLMLAHPDYYQLCGGNGDLIDAAAIAVYGRTRMDANRSGALLRGEF